MRANTMMLAGRVELRAAEPMGESPSWTGALRPRFRRIRSAETEVDSVHLLSGGGAILAVREEHAHDGAAVILAGAGSDLNGAGIFLDQLFRDPESQAGAADALGGEEGLEYVAGG